MLTLTNSVDPDEMPQYAAFHLGLHCLLKYPFRGFPFTKGYVSAISTILIWHMKMTGDVLVMDSRKKVVIFDKLLLRIFDR